MMHNVIGAAVVVASYGFVFWRIVQSNRGNKVIECGTITIVLTFTMVALIEIPNFPTWVVALLGLLVLLLGLLTLCFLFQQAYQALRRRKPN